MSPQALASCVGLNCLVFITGAAVMMLEVLGTRLLSPYFGVALYVWTALIFVTLISLAAGYYCGGELADRYPGWKVMSAATTGTATMLLLIPILAPELLPLTNTWGTRSGALASAAALFGPPLFLLAMVVPAAVKARTASLEQIGSSVGSLYGVSTVGSCLGTVLIAYVLIPSMRTYSILYLLSMCLAATASLHALLARQRREAAVAGVVLVIGLCKFITSPGAIANQEGDVRLLFRAESMYGRVQVVDDALYGVRWLMSDGSVVGGESLEAKTTFYPFLRMSEAVRYLNPSGTRALAIGLGTGAVPKALAQKGIRTDVVELDPNVVRAAREFFGFEPDGELFVEDGRRFLQRTTTRYDFIVHDTFTGGAVPFHLISRQVFAQIRRILTEQGVLCVVFVGYLEGERALATRSVFATLSKVFPHVRAVTDSVSESRPSNVLFFASNQPLPWRPAEWTGLSANTRTYLERPPLPFLATDGFVVTDELNPVDLWQVAASEAYRTWILEQFRVDLLID